MSIDRKERDDIVTETILKKKSTWRARAVLQLAKSMATLAARRSRVYRARVRGAQQLSTASSDVLCVSVCVSLFPNPLCSHPARGARGGEAAGRGGAAPVLRARSPHDLLVCHGVCALVVRLTCPHCAMYMCSTGEGERTRARRGGRGGTALCALYSQNPRLLRTQVREVLMSTLKWGMCGNRCNGNICVLSQSSDLLSHSCC